MVRESSGLKRVNVVTGYRIHLGFYRFLDPPYAYGGMGLSLLDPKVSVEVEINDNDVDRPCINAPTAESREVVRSVLNELGVHGVRVSIKGFIAHHKGLGCRTRITSALVQGLKELGLISSDVEGHLRTLSRGSISAVGIYTFLKGGFVADTGVRIDSPENPPSLLISLEFPNEWGILVFLPHRSPGLSGDREREVLTEVREHPRQGDLYRYFTQLITSVKMRDFNVFVNSLHKLQVLTGEYFRSFQGGVFREDVIELIETLKRAGVLGIGQSSWGPVVYGFIKLSKDVNNTLKRINDLISELGFKCDVYLTKASNSRGYRIEVK